MSQLFIRTFSRSIKIPTTLIFQRYKSKKPPKSNTMGDPLDIATGLEKREMLARLAGNDDPFGDHPIRRGPGTKECPNEVPSSHDKRIVGCLCSNEDTVINYMWLHKGRPKRCECGHWFVLVPKAPL